MPDFSDGIPDKDEETKKYLDIEDDDDDVEDDDDYDDYYEDGDIHDFD